MPLDYPEPVAADWPDLLKIVEEKVRPGRMKVSDVSPGFGSDCPEPLWNSQELIFGQALRVADREVLHASVAVMHEVVDVGQTLELSVYRAVLSS